MRDEFNLIFLHILTSAVFNAYTPLGGVPFTFTDEKRIVEKSNLELYGKQ